MEMARLSLAVLQALWLREQQHPAQFEQSSGEEQLSQDVSVHPHDSHGGSESPDNVEPLSLVIGVLYGVALNEGR